MPRIVRFSPETKTNDGLSKNAHIFTNYINDLFRKPGDPKKGSSIKIPQESLDIRTLELYRKMLIDLMERCRSIGHAPVLPQGGHSGIIKLEHMPYFRQCLSHLDNVISIVMTKLEQNAVKTLVSLSIRWI